MPKLFATRWFYGLFLLVIVALLLEAALRLYFAVQIGPRVLAYGTSAYRNTYGDRRHQQITEDYAREESAWFREQASRNTVYTHDDARGGFVKFFPNEIKFDKDIDSGEVFQVTINSHGFRGKEFSRDKPAGVIRVLTLGASSTFGIWSRDDETYPYQLELMLNQRCRSGKTFEVINFAIPHAIADQIVAMFMAEGLALQPDVITFYEGRNDSNRMHPLRFHGGRAMVAEAGLLLQVWQQLSRRLVTLRFIDELITATARLSAAETRALLEHTASRISREFLLDLERLRRLAQQQEILFIVANQQANAKSWFGLPAEQRLGLKGLSYQQEAEQIRALLAQGAGISGYEFNFLVHERLMKDLKAWAQRQQLPFVDIIDLLDQERHHMVSWVHLDSYANKRLAAALADQILSHQCPVTDS